LKHKLVEASNVLQRCLATLINRGLLDRNAANNTLVKPPKIVHEFLQESLQEIMSSLLVPQQKTPLRPRNRSTAKRGWNDLVDGFESWRVWHLMGVGTLRRRYSRSRLGQFWTTLTTGIMIAAMGAVWSLLFHLKLAELLPSLASGFVLWTFMSGVINESTGAVTNSGNYFLNQDMPFSVPIFAIIYYQLITLAHNAVIIVIVFVIFPPSLNFNILLFFPALLLIIISLISISSITAILCARYRDVIQLVANIIQTAFFVTPVMFRPDAIPEKYHWLNLINPFAVLLEISRSPLLGNDIHWVNWAIALGLAIGGALVAIPMIGHYRKRVIFWI
jgi:lipopolysaccharide transport system permease protein